ncbi:MAG: hypothetical protein ACIARR_08340 [Phycisphaerales bacterium JB059]
MVRIPDERVFRIATGEGSTLYVRSSSEAVARNVVARRGLHATSVLWVGLSEVPHGAEVIEPPPPREPGVSDIARSALLQRPVRTIALGVFLGLLAAWVFMVLLTLITGGALQILAG